MPRIRSLKPAFGQHEELSALPPETHLLAANLLTYADDEGYFKAHPKLVEAHCCPLREDPHSVRDSLQMLHQAGYVELFEGIDGKQYGWIVNFTRHQRVSHPSPSTIKGLRKEQEDSTDTPEDSAKAPEEPRREGKGREEEKDSRRDAIASPPESPREYIWRVGVDLLTSAGEKDRSARSFLGRLCRDFGDDAVREAVGRAVAIVPAEPKAWIKGALSNSNQSEEYYE